MSSEEQLAAFLAKYTPDIEARAAAILNRMRELLPGAVQMVYDNYNALAIGFSPSEKVSDAIFSIAVYPRWVSLFFLHGAGLSDAEGILQGSGNVVRHVVSQGPEDLDTPAIADLMRRALLAEGNPLDATCPGRLIIKSVSVRQRPRRPAK